VCDLLANTSLQPDYAAAADVLMSPSRSTPAACTTHRMDLPPSFPEGKLSCIEHREDTKTFVMLLFVLGEAAWRDGQTPPELGEQCAKRLSTCVKVDNTLHDAIRANDDLLQ